MNIQEIKDFIYFKEKNLKSIDIFKGKVESFNKKEVGYKNPDGYIRFYANKKLRSLHRFIYWYVFNDLSGQVDHIDRNRSNNSISNLRLVSPSQNCLNRNKRKFY